MRTNKQKIQDALNILNRVNLQMRPRKNIERLAGSIELELMNVQRILEDVKRNLEEKTA